VLCWTPGSNTRISTKTPAVAFRAYGGSGGDPGLPNALHRHPRLLFPSTLRTRRFCAARSPSRGGQLIPSSSSLCGQMGLRRLPTFLVDLFSHLGPPPAVTRSRGNRTEAVYGRPRAIQTGGAFLPLMSFSALFGGLEGVSALSPLPAPVRRRKEREGVSLPYSLPSRLCVRGIGRGGIIAGEHSRTRFTSPIVSSPR